MTMVKHRSFMFFFMWLSATRSSILDKDPYPLLNQPQVLIAPDDGFTLIVLQHGEDEDKDKAKAET